MAVLLQAFLAMFILQIKTDAAPSDISKIEDIAKVDDSKLNLPVSLIDDDNTNDKTQGQRQKRFYDFYGYGFPPINPIIYPNYPKRDQSSNLGTYGYEDPLTQIHRRIQELAHIARKPQPPQAPLPVLFPVIVIPFAGCPCNRRNPPKSNATDPNNNVTDPNVMNRFPDLDDERQNWGFVINDNSNNADDYDDDLYSRPISFDPIVPANPTARPAPPVEHGSNQGSNGNPETTTTTTSRPSTTVSSIPNAPPAASSSVPNAPPAAASSERSPTTCDGAILSCCHQPQVTYDCFVLQGCSDPTSYGNPCAPNVILRVIERFQRFYSKRNG